MRPSQLERLPASKPMIAEPGDWAAWGVADALNDEPSYADHTLPEEPLHTIYNHTHSNTKLKLLLLGDDYEQSHSAETIRAALEESNIPAGKERCDDLALRATEDWF